MGPGGTHFLVAGNSDLLHNELQVWRTRPFRSVWVTGSHLWRYPRAVWRDSATIEVTRVPTVAAIDSAEGRLLPASELFVVVRTADGWQQVPEE